MSTDEDLDQDTLLIKLRGHITSEWYQFGQVIGVPEDILQHLQDYTVEESLVEMLDYWLRHHPNQPTWNEIAHAVSEVGLYQLAENIMQVYETGY